MSQGLSVPIRTDGVVEPVLPGSSGVWSKVQGWAPSSLHPACCTLYGLGPLPSPLWASLAPFQKIAKLPLSC